jgi:hypothetical protein
MHAKRVMLRIFVLSCAATLVPTLVGAVDVVCGDATQMSRYIRSTDPSQMSDGTCAIIGKANVASQRALVESQPLDKPIRYLKVVGGLATSKTQAEKDAADAVAASDLAASQVFVDETTSAVNDLCGTALLSDIDTRIDALKGNLKTSIDAVTNIASAQSALTSMNNIYAAAFKKIARCIVARRFTR